jgi:Domain of unknown function (DUF4160)
MEGAMTTSGMGWTCSIPANQYHGSQAEAIEMPVVFRFEGFRFFFYSNEGDPREPVHIHVRKGEAVAKFWISPVSLADSEGFDAKTLRRLERVVVDRTEAIERSWHEHFG